MSVKLTCQNFFNNYMINCNAKELSVKDQRKALIRSIALGVIFVAIPHIVCALNTRCVKHKKPTETSSTETPLTFKENPHLNPLFVKALKQCLAAVNASSDDKYLLVDSLLELGKIIIPFDKKNALKMFKIAKQKETNNPDHVERSLALAEIAVATPKEKMSIANSLEGKNKAFVLRQIAIDFAKDNIEKGLEIVDQLSGINRFQALIGIIKIVTPSNYELGLKLANEATELVINQLDNGFAIEAFLDVFFAKYDLQKAFELADAIKPHKFATGCQSDLKETAFCIIGKEYVKSNFTEAVKWADTLDLHTRLRVLCSMVKELSSIQPELAKELMNQALRLRKSTNEDIFELDKIICVETMALLDLDKALELLQEIKSGKAEALVNIVKVLMRVVPEAALKVAARLFEEESVKNITPSTRFHLFMELAKAISLAPS